MLFPFYEEKMPRDAQQNNNWPKIPSEWEIKAERFYEYVKKIIDGNKFT